MIIMVPDEGNLIPAEPQMPQICETKPAQLHEARRSLAAQHMKKDLRPITGDRSLQTAGKTLSTVWLGSFFCLVPSATRKQLHKSGSDRRRETI